MSAGRGRVPASRVGLRGARARRRGLGAGRRQAADAVGYLLAGAEKEPAGVWGGEGLSMLGVQAGTAASADQVRAVFGRLEHPSRVDARTGEALAVG